MLRKSSKGGTMSKKNARKKNKVTRKARKRTAKKKMFYQL